MLRRSNVNFLERNTGASIGERATSLQADSSAAVPANAPINTRQTAACNIRFMSRSAKRVAGVGDVCSVSRKVDAGGVLTARGLGTGKEAWMQLLQEEEDIKQTCTHSTNPTNIAMPAELNGLPANGTANGINGHTDELSNPTPADAAFDSIPDVVAAFGQPAPGTTHDASMTNSPSQR
ncbi:hypothetical protein OPT61_g8368 [Boeremia exigua]|uniref:Uncharacterized protein n=1 Tax=Boeremia exigua TaxID=749465 RepID=A0ACC2HYR7_9PLEO|nr:hypothetical protein OPT61_g8368 [Boeremia exigua]